MTVLPSHLPSLPIGLEVLLLEVAIGRCLLFTLKVQSAMFWLGHGVQGPGPFNFQEWGLLTRGGVKACSTMLHTNLRRARDIHIHMCKHVVLERACHYTSSDAILKTISEEYWALWLGHDRGSGGFGFGCYPTCRVMGLRKYGHKYLICG